MAMDQHCTGRFSTAEIPEAQHAVKIGLDIPGGAMAAADGVRQDGHLGFMIRIVPSIVIRDVSANMLYI